MLACTIAVMVVVVRWLAVWPIKRLAPPVPGYQEQVGQAIEAADLPTGPFSVVRLLNRLRKCGVDDEVDRLRQVLEDVGDEDDES